ncbi:MAG: starvation-sensing protein RspA, partial [Eubacteriales bacterium]|nr:starvation-sensing protein RspA [Eubacteriales bacterium]
MGLKITDVRVIYTAPQGVNLLTVRVDTNEAGLYGLGCATFTQRHHAVITAIEEYVKPYLIGRDPLRIEDNWQAMMGSSYWRNGPVLNNALSGADMALWDILGKVAGLPVYQLLGGKCREAAAAYTHVSGETTQEVLEMVEKTCEEGYQHVRVQVGVYGGKTMRLRSPDNAPDGAYYDPKAYMRETLAMIEKVRERFGPELEICHDVHERLAPADAAAFAKEVE